MYGCISCGFQSGASYQYSPLSTSILPSLFTSATATPSDRNLVSRTVFFQVIFVSSAGFAAGRSAALTRATAATRGNRRNMGRSSLCGGTWVNYPGKPGRCNGWALNLTPLPLSLYSPAPDSSEGTP